MAHPFTKAMSNWHTSKLLSNLTILVVGLMMAYMFVGMYSQIPSADEVIFLRVTATLPHYSVVKEWFTIDKSDPNITVEPSRDYNLYYQVPYWEHPMLDSLISYPLVKLFWHDGNAQQAIASVTIFRTIAWCMMCGSILLALYIVKRRTGNNLIVFLSSLVLLAAIPFFASWHGDNWWYYDTFMFLFMMVALAMIGTKYERFIYIPLALMVGSELTGVLLLVPFIIRNPKTILSGLAIVPHFIHAGIVTGNMMYMFDFWRNTIMNVDANAVTFQTKFLREWHMIIANIKWGWITLIVTLPSFIYLAFRKITRENIFYPVLFAMCLIIGYIWLKAYYHMWGVVLIGIVMAGMNLANYNERKVVSA
jgi:hypothetical protein